MILTIDSHSGVPVYRQIMNQIRQQVLTEQLKEGEQIEHVRNLAGRLKVNPMTVSKAYGYLEMEGILKRQRGIGLFIAKIEKSEKRRLKMEMLEKSMKRLVLLAIQMGLEEEEAGDLFLKYYRIYNSREGVLEE
ncbi:MAG: hypothetical protein A2161_18155 [Candidatus Schekmanbacteria bacterium RBG_13_48_7]|uniref:HTH gntR-type domain-containing protein n=1 Tax=Candidatus Schekmanbacteria bacterium RBG_13_48_7 TaxID=1817878 RepID=A0A1F7RR13_9BACT|nr:MAG: hypothetical protein A2161_18155 [Candidatus Schekmanbacteria bacterium RBG_13_48_7]